jgi:hypothetical protein
MTLQYTSGDDGLALVPNESKGRYIMSTRMIYPPTCVAPSTVQVVDDRPVNGDYYAIRILKAYDMDHIQLLYRFGIFSHSDLLTEVLKRRWGPFLDALHCKLNQSHHPGRIIRTLGLDEKVNQIECLLRSAPQDCMPSGPWVPEVTVDDEKVATIINNASTSTFRRIQFPDFVRQAFLDVHGPWDAASGPIQDFRLWHTNLKQLLYTHLRKHPNEERKYKLVNIVRPNELTGSLAKFISRNCNFKTLSLTGLFQRLLRS